MYGGNHVRSNRMDLVNPAPPYVLVTFKNAVGKVVETQPAMSNQGWRDDCKGQASLVYTSKAVDLVCYGATNEAI
jgi:hypothetical protein